MDTLFCDQCHWTLFPLCNNSPHHVCDSSSICKVYFSRQSVHILHLKPETQEQFLSTATTKTNFDSGSNCPITSSHSSSIISNHIRSWSKFHFRRIMIPFLFLITFSLQNTDSNYTEQCLRLPCMNLQIEFRKVLHVIFIDIAMDGVRIKRIWGSIQETAPGFNKHASREKSSPTPTGILARKCHVTGGTWHILLAIASNDVSWTRSSWELIPHNPPRLMHDKKYLRRGSNDSFLLVPNIWPSDVSRLTD